MFYSVEGKGEDTNEGRGEEARRGGGRCRGEGELLFSSTFPFIYL